MGAGWCLLYHPALPVAGVVGANALAGLALARGLAGRGASLVRAVLAILLGLGAAPALAALLYAKELVWGWKGLLVTGSLALLGASAGALWPGSASWRGLRPNLRRIAAGVLGAGMVAAVVSQRQPQSVSALRVRSLSAVPAPVLLLGIDCGDWRVLQPLLDRGELPALAKLVARGRHGVLRSIEPTESPVVGTTMLTGQPRSRHGITGWDRADARNRREPELWEIFAAAGARTVTVNVPGTWPPRPLPRGILVSGFPIPGLDTGTVGFHLGTLLSASQRTSPVRTARLVPAGPGRWTLNVPLVGCGRPRFPWLRHALVDVLNRRHLLGTSLAFRGTCTVRGRELRIEADSLEHPIGLGPGPGLSWAKLRGSGGGAVLGLSRLSSSPDQPELYLTPPFQDPESPPHPFLHPQRLSLVSSPHRPYIVEGPGWTASRDPLIAQALPRILLDIEERHMEAARRLVERFHPTLATYVVTVTDRLQHAYLALNRPDLYPDLPPHVRRLRGQNPVAEGYRLADRALARLLELMPPNTTVFVVSDHGVAPRPETGTAEHRVEGIWIAAGPGIEPGDGPTLGLLDVAPTILACAGLPVSRDLPGKAHWELCPEAPRRPAVGSYLVSAADEGPVTIGEDRRDQLRGLGYIE